MQIRKYFSLVLIILIAFSTSSCISLLNEIKINSDKSGTSFIGIELGGLSNFLDMDSKEIDPDIKSSLMDIPNTASEKLKDIDGINNIKTLATFTAGRLGISFDFKNMRALNKAYYALSSNDKKWYYPKLVKIKKHKVHVKDISPLIKYFVEQNNDDPNYAALINLINYKTRVIVPNNISASKKGVDEIKYKGKAAVNNSSLESIMNNDANTSIKFNY